VLLTQIDLILAMHHATMPPTKKRKPL